MLKWALIFVLLAMVAAGLGFSGIAGVFAGTAKVLFFIFLAAIVITVILGLTILGSIQKMD